MQDSGVSVEPKEQIPALVPGIDFKPPGGPHPPIDETAKKLYQDTLPSIMRVGTNKAVGSGFFIDDKGTVATDAHVVLDSKEHYLIDQNGVKRRLRIDRLDDIHDLAILKPITPFASQPLTLGHSTQLRFGQPIFAVGNPKGVEKTYISPGFMTGYSTPIEVIGKLDPDLADRIASRNLNDQDYTDYYFREVIAGLIHVEHGNSGGPVLDKKGEVIGLTDMGIPEASRGYMTPVEHLTELRDGNGKYRFTYEYQPEPWAKSYTSLWGNKPFTATLATGYGVGLGAATLWTMSKVPRIGGGIAVLGGALAFSQDYDHFCEMADKRDALKYRVAMTADTATTIGGLALISLRNKSYGVGAIALGVAGRLGADFIPNHFVNTAIDRLDGTKKPIMGSKSGEMIFNNEHFFLNGIPSY